MINERPLRSDTQPPTGLNTQFLIEPDVQRSSRPPPHIEPSIGALTRPITALDVAQQEEEALVNAFFGSPVTRGGGRGRGRGTGIGSRRARGRGRGRGRGTLTEAHTTAVKGLSYARGHEGQFGVIQF